jgi:hypothetical protein
MLSRVVGEASPLWRYVILSGVKGWLRLCRSG